MTGPLFACFPMCWTFLALGLVGVVVYVAGMTGPAADPPAPTVEPAGPRPPYWVLPATAAVIVAVLALLSLVCEW